MSRNGAGSIKTSLVPDPLWEEGGVQEVQVTEEERRGQGGWAKRSLMGVR